MQSISGVSQSGHRQSPNEADTLVQVHEKFLVALQQFGMSPVNLAEYRGGIHPDSANDIISGLRTLNPEGEAQKQALLTLLHEYRQSLSADKLSYGYFFTHHQSKDVLDAVAATIDRLIDTIDEDLSEGERQRPPEREFFTRQRVAQRPLQNDGLRQAPPEENNSMENENRVGGLRQAGLSNSRIQANQQLTTMRRQDRERIFNIVLPYIHQDSSESESDEPDSNSSDSFRHHSDAFSSRRFDRNNTFFEQRVGPGRIGPQWPIHDDSEEERLSNIHAVLGNLLSPVRQPHGDFRIASFMNDPFEVPPDELEINDFHYPSLPRSALFLIGRHRHGNQDSGFLFQNPPWAGVPLKYSYLIHDFEKFEDKKKSEDADLKTLLQTALRHPAFDEAAAKRLESVFSLLQTDSSFRQYCRNIGTRDGADCADRAFIGLVRIFCLQDVHVKLEQSAKAVEARELLKKIACAPLLENYNCDLIDDGRENSETLSHLIMKINEKYGDIDLPWKISKMLYGGCSKLGVDGAGELTREGELHVYHAALMLEMFREEECCELRYTKDDQERTFKFNFEGFLKKSNEDAVNYVLDKCYPAQITEFEAWKSKIIEISDRYTDRKEQMKDGDYEKVMGSIREASNRLERTVRSQLIDPVFRNVDSEPAAFDYRTWWKTNMIDMETGKPYPLLADNHSGNSFFQRLLTFFRS